MTDIRAHDQTPSPSSEIIGSDGPSLREASRNLAWRREQEDGPDEIETPDTWDVETKRRMRENSAGDVIDEGVSAKDAADALATYRAEKAQQQKEWAEALALAGEELSTSDAPQPTQGYEQSEAPVERPHYPQAAADPSEHEIRHAATQIEQARNSVAQDAAEVAKNIQAMFPEIRFMSAHEAQDIAALAHSNPDRHQMLLRAAGVVQQVVGRAHQVHAAETQLHQIAANHQQQQQLTAWRAEQCRIVEAKHPEFRRDARGNYVEPEKAIALQHKAVAYLREQHSDQEIMAAIADGRLDDAKNVLVILDAVRYRDAQAAMKAVKAKPLPPVQRPGVAQPIDRDRSGVEALERIANKDPTPRNMARVLAARRAAAR